ncbi:GM22903 [Drosophila sechellia]|uniref:GM22903 n=1 Tax=Drosophila sechellia TaxID=7238 RepID=B4I6U1_DROSE|nr:GM22903 [Drosophila sechellia]
MPETLPATATVTASSIDCTVAVLKVPTPTLQLPEVCNLQSLGLIMEPNNINIELNPAALVTPAMEPVGFKDLTHIKLTLMAPSRGYRVHGSRAARYPGGTQKV